MRKLDFDAETMDNLVNSFIDLCQEKSHALAW